MERRVAFLSQIDVNRNSRTVPQGGGAAISHAGEVPRKTHSYSLITALLFVGCAGTVSVLGMPTVVSDVEVDVPPEATNPEEVREAMRAEYPPLLRDAGIRATAVLRLYVDEAGQVQEFVLDEGSSHRALDDMALRLAPNIQFSPARYAGERVPVSVTVRLNFLPPPPGRVEKRAIRRDD